MSQPCLVTDVGFPRHFEELQSVGVAQRAAQAKVILGLVLIVWAAAVCLRSGLRSGLQAFNVKRLLRSFQQQEMELQKYANAHQLEFWRVTFKVMMTITTAWLAVRFAVWQRNGPGLEVLLTGSACERVVFDILGDNFSIACYILLSALVFCTFPRLLTTRTLHCWIIVSSVVNQWYFVSLNNLMPFSRLSQQSIMARVLLSMHCPSITFVVLMNLAASVFQTYATMRVYDANDVPLIYEHEVLIAQVVTFSGILIISLVTRRLLLHQIRSTMAAKSSRNVKASTEKVLRGICDAVVHLRSDLTLDDVSPQLNALLLRTGAGSARMIDGSESFLDFLYDDTDKQRFRDFVAETEVESGFLPDTLHVTMRDAHQTKVTVQCFHAQFLDAVDECFHIIGILDQSNAGERSLLNVTQFHVGGDVASLSTREQLSQGSTSEPSSQSQQPLSAEVLPQVLDDVAGEAAVWIDTHRQGMPMVKCSNTFFTSMGGPSLKKHTQFLSWAPRKERAEVSREIQARMNDLHHTAHYVDGGFQVCLRPRHMGRHRVQAHLVMSLEPECETEDSVLDDMICKITFTHLQLTVGGRDERNSRGNRPLSRQQGRASLQL